jgi:hypothetical protein
MTQLPTYSEPDHVPDASTIRPGWTWVGWRLTAEQEGNTLWLGEITADGPVVNPYDVTGLVVEIDHYREQAYQVRLSRAEDANP